MSAARRPPWHNIPELRDIPLDRAEDVFEVAQSRAWRHPRVWATGVAHFAVYVAVFIAFPSMFSREVRRSVPYWILYFAAVGIVAYVLTRAVIALHRPILRRCVRAALGTHCAACDYDLRATPDLPPPATARCPECGKPIPRNVHRPTLRPPSAP